MKKILFFLVVLTAVLSAPNKAQAGLYLSVSAYDSPGYCRPTSYYGDGYYRRPAIRYYHRSNYYRPQVRYYSRPVYYRNSPRYHRGYRHHRGYR